MEKGEKEADEEEGEERPQWMRRRQEKSCWQKFEEDDDVE